MPHPRVIPRDLFNEAKLLKGLGRLALMIHDGLAGPLAAEHDGDPFVIEQDPSDGGLYVANLTFRVGARALELKSVYNSKAPYPLVFAGLDGGEEPVFDDGGFFTRAFTDWLRAAANAEADD